MALPGEIVYLARSGIAFLLIREMIRSHMILTMVSYGITNGDRRLSFCFLFFFPFPFSVYIYRTQLLLQRQCRLVGSYHGYYHLLTSVFQSGADKVYCWVNSPVWFPATKPRWLLCQQMFGITVPMPRDGGFVDYLNATLNGNRNSIFVCLYRLHVKLKYMGA